MAKKRFEAWYAERAKKLGLDPNRDDPRHFYDYRAAHKAGADVDPKTKHWPSTYKSIDHPTRFMRNKNGFVTDTATGKVMVVPTTARRGKPPKKIYPMH